MHTDTSVVDVDVTSPQFMADPYPTYARIQAASPCWYIPGIDMWWITRYADAVDVLKDQRFGKEPVLRSGHDEQPPQRLPALLPPSMFIRDPPEHTRLRSLINRAFTPRVIDQMQPAIEAIVADLLNRAAIRSRIDLVADFAYPLPVTVVGRLVGVPDADLPAFRTWANGLLLAMDATQPEQVKTRGEGAGLELVDYVRRLITARRLHPQFDLLSALIAAEENHSTLTPDEILGTCILLLVAGHETTTNLIATGTLSLLRHPDQLQGLQRDPALVDSAVEELLRYESPFQRLLRYVREDLALQGTSLRTGDRVAVIIGAANRDPAVFEDPHRLDIRRANNPHIAFGRGIHYCLGAALAVLEARIAFTHLVRRFRDLALAADPVWNTTTIVRGVRSLPVSL